MDCTRRHPEKQPCGKITVGMNEQTAKIEVSPPRLIPSLVSGFNATANHIQLILFPIALDLLLWFAPHLRLKVLLQPFITEMNQVMLTISSEEVKGMSSQIQEMWQITLDRFNLLSLLRTYPIGIPSLLSSQGTLQNPLGNTQIIEITSTGVTVLLWVLIILAGMFLGCVYFNEISRLTAPEKRPFSLRNIFWENLQMMLMTLGLILLLLAVSIPFSILISVIAVFSPAFAQIVVIFIILAGLWILLPVFFSPHGVFEKHLNILTSMLLSLRLVRLYIASASLFIFILFLISEGMNVLWLMAPEVSWMLFVGVAGHAIVSTGVIVSSFMFYRAGLLWMDAYLQKMSANQAKNPAI
jgi:hypothetical protein